MPTTEWHIISSKRINDGKRDYLSRRNEHRLAVIFKIGWPEPGPTLIINQFRILNSHLRLLFARLLPFAPLHKNYRVSVVGMLKQIKL